ncbi:MAG: hypothetical protein U9P14_11050 [Gemmatimonadota bacterium]|nr:hypothetical protein [Gemmatimonadota bacterium]
MELELQQSKIDLFTDSLKKLAPWMNQYKFSDEMVVGYYKYDGLGEEMTFCHSRSPRERIECLLNAYHSNNHSIWMDFVRILFDRLELQSPGNAALLDISSATGHNSILAVDYGFGKVYSSEIRKHQCDQQNLIYDCLEDQKYRQRITVANDTISADSPDFIDLYRDVKLDTVLSFGLLYHLMNPVQHIRNLYEITDRYAIIYTMTHQEPNMETLWKLRLENKDWITKATSSISWCPHFMGLPEIIKQIGFRSVQIVYPEVFNRNFPVKAYSVKKMALQKQLRKFGIKVGYYKNLDFNFFKQLTVNPSYYAYILEK